MFMFAPQHQLHYCGFSDVVNLLGRAPGTALHLDKNLVKQVTIKELKVSKIKWHGYFSKCVFISCLLLLTLQLMV